MSPRRPLLPPPLLFVPPSLLPLPLPPVPLVPARSALGVFVVVVVWSPALEQPKAASVRPSNIIRLRMRGHLAKPVPAGDRAMSTAYANRRGLMTTANLV